MKPSVRKAMTAISQAIKIEQQIEIAIFGVLFVLAILFIFGYSMYLGLRHYQMQ